MTLHAALDQAIAIGRTLDVSVDSAPALDAIAGPVPPCHPEPPPPPPLGLSLRELVGWTALGVAVGLPAAVAHVVAALWL